MTNEEGVVRRADAVWRDVEGETIVLDLASSQYLGINSTGTLLWEAIAQPTTVDALVRLLVERFEIGQDRALVDVEAFLQECARRGLLDQG